MRLIWRSRFLFVVLLCVGCASQDPNYLRLKARDMLDVARRKNPRDPRLATARATMERGNKEFIKSDYNLARYYFKNSIRASEDIIEQFDSHSIAKTASPLPSPSPSPGSLVSAMAKSTENTAEPPPALDSSDDTSLVIDFELPKNKKVQFPGALIFPPDDEHWEAVSLKHLDAVGEYLMREPDVVLYLKGELAQNEAPVVVGARFRVVVSYLEEVGVSNNRIKLEPTATRSTRPLFKFFMLRSK